MVGLGMELPIFTTGVRKGRRRVGLICCSVTFSGLLSSSGKQGGPVESLETRDPRDAGEQRRIGEPLVPRIRG